MKTTLIYAFSILLLAVAVLPSCKEDPSNVSVTKVTLDNKTLSLEAGDSKTIKATILPDNATEKGLSWTSNAEAVATVSDGVVKAIAKGTATITVVTKDGGLEDVCQVTVTEPVVTVAATGVELDKATIALEIGGTDKLTADVLPGNATDKSVTWSSSSEAIATVDQEGLVTAVAIGEATIKVKTTDGGHEKTCAVTVKDKIISVTGVLLDKATLSLETEDTATLTAIILPKGATNQSVSWKSSANAVAAVDKDGKVTAVSAGTATVTVKTDDGGFEKSCAVTVTDKIIRVTGIDLDKPALSLEAGDTATLVATVQPGDASDRSVIWSSTVSTIAMVDQQGKVTAIAAGTAIIKVKTTDGGFEKSCAVAVTEPTNDTWARSNIVWVPDSSKPDGGYLTFAATPADNANIPANAEGLLFKFGSLIAVTAVGIPESDTGYSAGKYPNGNIVYSPTAKTNYTFLGIPQYVDQSAYDDSQVSTDDFKDYNGGTGFDASAGKGDICRYISSKGWVAGSWRLPTGKEVADYIAATPIVNDVADPELGGPWRGAVHGTPTPVTVIPAGSNSYGDHAHGFYQITYGRIMGTSPSVDDDITNPTSGTFFPTSGMRNTDGKLTSVGKSGHYWTGSAYKVWAWQYYFGRKAGSNTQRPESNAYAIRCVRVR